ncbi:MAG: hypothetical protein ACO4AU_15975 [bacterium]
MIIRKQLKEDRHSITLQGASSAKEMQILISQLLQLIQPTPGKTILLELNCQNFAGLGPEQEPFQIRVVFETRKR